jgi:hypothetical protein
MKKEDLSMKSFRVLGAVAGLMLLTFSTGQADETRYAPWQGQVQTGDMPELLRNLRTLTDKADRDKAASPAFLADLRALTGEYENRLHWPVGLLYDNFRDGEFTSNPAWTVVAGDWRIDNRGGSPALYSRVRSRGPSTQGSNSGNTSDLLAGALGALLNQQGGQTQQNTQGQQNQQGPATIVVPVAISDQFFIRLEMTSRESGGQFNFGPYAGQRAERSYQLAYAPGAANGLILSRVSDRGSQVLGMSRGPINLEDNQAHFLEWKRGPGGKMTVALDGRPVIEATDAQFRKPFNGFLMINSGGTYGIRSVAINGMNQ